MKQVGAKLRPEWRFGMHFFTAGATISAVGEAQKSEDVPLALSRRRALLDGLLARVPEAIVATTTCTDQVRPIIAAKCSDNCARIGGRPRGIKPDRPCGHALIQDTECLREVRSKPAGRALWGDLLKVPQPHPYAFASR
jgi:hypothetical protein